MADGGVTPSYVRLYADARGESHFEDVVLPTTTQVHTSGALTDVSELVPATGLIFRRIVQDVAAPDERDATPHTAPYPVFIITLQGAAAVTVSDGETRVFGPGSVVLAQDTEGRGHMTVPVGEEPRVTIFAPAQ